jgi:hypothetical protein
MLDDSGGYLSTQIEALFAIFYVNDGYIHPIERCRGPSGGP